jgi:hypothetical protein
MKVAVVGLGYVGTVTAPAWPPTAMTSGESTSTPTKVDPRRSQPGGGALDALVAQAVADGTSHATMSCIEALDGTDVSLVCVGTPPAARKARLRHRIRVLVPRDGLADAQGTTVRPVRGDSGLQTRRTSSGRSPWCFASLIAPGSRATTTTCAPSCTSLVSLTARGCLQGAAGPGAQDSPHGEPRDLHQRLLSRRRRNAKWQVDHRPRAPLVGYLGKRAAGAPARATSACWPMPCGNLTELGTYGQ